MVLGSHVFEGGVPTLRARAAARDRAPALPRRAGAADHRLRRGVSGIRRARRHGRLAGAPRRRAADVVIDRGGYRTAASMADAAAIGVQSLLVVSQRYHLPRAIYLASHAGMSAVGVPARARSARTLGDASSASCARRWRARRSWSRSRCAACAVCRGPDSDRADRLSRGAARAELRGRARGLQTAPRLVRNGRMRNSRFVWRSCRCCSRSPPASSRTQDKPTADDLTVAKQNLLTTAPVPRYPVNADFDGKVVFLGMDVDPLPAEPGKDLKLTQYWKVVTPPGDGWKTFTHVEGPSKQGYINADHVPIQGKYPVERLESRRHHPRHPHRADARRLDLPGGRGLRRSLARGHADDGQVRAPTTAKGACWRRRSRCARPNAVEPRKRYVARMAQKPPKLDGKLDDAGLGGGAVDRAVRQHPDRRAGGAGDEDRGQAALGQEEPLRRRSTTPTTTSGPTSTSATTSSGPRRPTS